jgi:hypothetical protein
MTDAESRPRGYSALREAFKAIAEHEEAVRRASHPPITSSRKKLSLPKFGNSEPHKRPLVR